jgi:hypothetical protein
LDKPSIQQDESLDLDTGIRKESTDESDDEDVPLPMRVPQGLPGTGVALLPVVRREEEFLECRPTCGTDQKGSQCVCRHFSEICYSCGL